MNKDFVSIKAIAVVAIFAVVAGGGTFGVYKYNQVQKQNGELIAEVEKQKEERIKQLEAELAAAQKTSSQYQELISTTTDNSPHDSEESGEVINEEPIIRTVVQEKIVYVPEPTPEVDPEPEELVPTEVETVEEIEEPKEQEPEPVETKGPISFLSAGQTAYPDGYGGVYGSYGLTLRVQADTETIYIPMTTNDSLGTGEIGFTYHVAGQEFRGTQDSEVSECTNFNNNLCKFKVGQDKIIKVTVWLFPDENSSGNYGVNFDTVTYFEGDERKQFTVDKATANINLIY